MIRGFLKAEFFGDGQIFPRGSRGYFRAGGSSKALPISRRTGKVICFVIGAGFAVGGAIAVATEFFIRR